LLQSLTLLGSAHQPIDAFEPAIVRYVAGAPRVSVSAQSQRLA
jgi:hypothetical protein